MLTHKQKVVVIFCSLWALMLLSAFTYAGTFGKLSEGRGIYAVNKIEPGPTYSIHAYGTRVNHNVFFHNCTHLRLENGGAWFVHEGKQKYISGNFWVEETSKFNKTNSELNTFWEKGDLYEKVTPIRMQ